MNKSIIMAITGFFFCVLVIVGIFTQMIIKFTTVLFIAALIGSLYSIAVVIFQMNIGQNARRAIIETYTKKNFTSELKEYLLDTSFTEISLKVDMDAKVFFRINETASPVHLKRKVKGLYVYTSDTIVLSSDTGKYRKMRDYVADLEKYSLPALDEIYGNFNPTNYTIYIVAKENPTAEYIENQMNYSNIFLPLFCTLVWCPIQGILYSPKFRKKKSFPLRHLEELIEFLISYKKDD